MGMVDGLVQSLDRLQPGLGGSRRAALEQAARDLLEDNQALLSLQEGEHVEDFELPDASGRPVGLSSLSARGPVVLTFYRGGWCDYCGNYLRTLDQALDKFREAGAELVAISPQTPEYSASTADKLDLGYPVLSDADNHVARRFGLVFRLPEAFRRAYEVLGIDLPRYNGTHSFELPIPATYVIDGHNRIVYASVDPNYTKRPDPAAVLAKLDALEKQAAEGSQVRA
jgi:peroxiredoxin